MISDVGFAPRTRSYSALSSLQMSSDDRRTFMDVLRRKLFPTLRADGFTGSGHTLRRTIDPVIHVINIRGSRYGGECCVNLGIHLQFLPTSLGDNANLRTLSEPLCEFRRRLKLEGESDHWWSYGSNETESQLSVADLISVYHDVGAPHFAYWTEFPGRFIEITVDRLARGDYDCLPGYATPVRAALAMARIHAHLGNTYIAHSLVSFGLAKLGRWTRLKSDFEELLLRL